MAATTTRRAIHAMNRNTAQRLMRLVVACLCFAATTAASQQSQTVLGPTNPDLYHGAHALQAGKAEDGIRLTLAGLEVADNTRHRLTGKSNLCAGYIMLEQIETALRYCNEVLEENDRYWRAYSNRALAYIELNRLGEAEEDLQKAEALAPHSRKVKRVRSMLLDKTDPVVPQIIIDDRRQTGDEDEQ